MRIKPRFYQAGGAAPSQGQDPMEQLIAMAAQAVQNNDTNLAMQVCQILVQAAQGAAQQEGQQAAAEEEAAEGYAPEEGGEEAGSEPVFRYGGRLARRISRRRW